jgi:hypothetical protein
MRLNMPLNNTPSSGSAQMWYGCPKAGIRLHTEMGGEAPAGRKASHGVYLYGRGCSDTAQNSIG